MKRIERHSFERDDSRERCEDRERTLGLTHTLLKASSDPVDQIESALRDARALACFAFATNDKSRTRRGLVVLAESSVALFDLASRPGVPVRVALDGATYELTVPQAHRMGGPVEWHDGFVAACAVRNASALAALSAVTKDVLDISRLSARFYEFLYEQIPGFQALAKRSPDAGALLTRALDTATKWDGDALMRDRYTTEIALALRLHEGDAARFNDALERALLAHRAYFTAPVGPEEFVDDRRDDPDGFLALGVLSLTCLAHDRGIAIDVESDYIPRWIVQREWP